MIVHLPFIKIVFPNNTQYLLEILMVLSNFDLIPAEYIIEKILKLFNIELDDENEDEN